MTRTFKFGAIAAAALIAAPAFAAAELGANVELDTTYYTKAADRMTQGGRVEVNVSGKKEAGGGYVAGKGTIGLTKAGGTFVDDAWVEAGAGSTAVRLGRFEAADLFPLGKDTIVVAGGQYNGNMLRGRKGAADTHVAIMTALGAGASFELGLLETATADKETSIGVRPVVSFTTSGITIKAGLEKQQGVDDVGFGITAGGSLEGVSFNANFAKMGDNTGIGLNAGFGAAGVGIITGDNGTSKMSAVYAAYTLPLLVEGASMTLAVSNGKDFAGVKETGLRVRLNYGF